MRADLKIGDNVFPYFVKLDVFRSIDALIHLSLRETVLDGLMHVQQKFRIRIHGWIVLPGTVKLILSSTDEALAIEEVVDGLINYTDRKLVLNIDRFRNEGKRRWMTQLFEDSHRIRNLVFWHSRYTLDPLHTSEQFSECLSDMHETPVRSGVVWDSQYYMYSSAIDYITGEPGLIPVIKLEAGDSFFS